MAGRRDPTLLALLARAYGSTLLAQGAVERALGHARLERLPASRDDLVVFACTHLYALIEADLGAFIADALTGQLLAGWDDSPQRPDPPATAPVTRVSVRSVKVAAAGGQAPPVDEEVTADLSRDPRREG
jgi:hypothetical protein